METKIIENILRKIDNPNLVEILASRLSFSEIQSLLMEVMDRKRKGLKLSGILQQYKTDGYVRPSRLNQKLQIGFDTIIESVLPENYHVIELSPVSPLGCCSQMSNISQNRIISTIRKNEVSSDPTNILALEASLRRRSDRNTVRLATSQRVLRSEREISDYRFAHFRIFCTCVAGKALGNQIFEINAMTELAELYDSILSAMQKNNYSFSGARMVFKFKDKVGKQRFESEARGFLERSTNLAVEAITDANENWNYYSSMRLNLFVRGKERELFIADGGDTTWTQKLLNNKKERCVISGFGSERFITAFRVDNGAI